MIWIVFVVHIEIFVKLIPLVLIACLNLNIQTLLQKLIRMWIFSTHCCSIVQHTSVIKSIICISWARTSHTNTSSSINQDPLSRTAEKPFRKQEEMTNCLESQELDKNIHIQLSRVTPIQKTNDINFPSTAMPIVLKVWASKCVWVSHYIPAKVLHENS